MGDTNYVSFCPTRYSGPSATEVQVLVEWYMFFFISILIDSNCGGTLKVKVANQGTSKHKHSSNWTPMDHHSGSMPEWGELEQRKMPVQVM